MNDYKELIEMLRNYSQDFLAYKLGCAFADAVDSAADAIERLVRERDEWKTLGSLANKRAEDYREMRRQRDKAIKERDAAIADLGHAAFCDYCKHYCKHFGYPRCKKSGRCEWEWRGVQEAEHE